MLGPIGPDEEGEEVVVVVVEADWDGTESRLALLDVAPGDAWISLWGGKEKTKKIANCG